MIIMIIPIRMKTFYTYYNKAINKKMRNGYRIATTPQELSAPQWR